MRNRLWGVLLVGIVTSCWGIRSHAVPVYAALFTGLSAGSSDETTGMEILNDLLRDEFSDLDFTNDVFTHTQMGLALHRIQQVPEPATIVAIGHSLGGRAAIELAHSLGPTPRDPIGGRNLDLLVQVDSVGTGLAGNTKPTAVERGVNYFQNSTGILEPQGARQIFGSENIDVEELLDDPSITHTSIDDDPELHELIADDVRAAIRNDRPLWINPERSDAFIQKFEGTDDGGFGFPLPFDFPFFGENLDEVVFSHNGALGPGVTERRVIGTSDAIFGAGDNVPLPQADPFPDNNSPVTLRPLIAPLMDDHDPSKGGVLSLEFLSETDPASGTPIFNSMIASWNNVPLYSGGRDEPPGARNTFQAALFGPGNPFGFAPGTIVFNYGMLNGVGGMEGPGKHILFEEALGTATVGLDNGEGAFATAPAGIGTTEGLVTLSDLAKLMNTDVDPLVFTPSGNQYTVSAVPFSDLPSIPGLTTDVPRDSDPTPAPEPNSLVMLSLALVLLLAYEAGLKLRVIRPPLHDRRSRGIAEESR